MFLLVFSSATRPREEHMAFLSQGVLERESCSRSNEEFDDALGLEVEGVGHHTDEDVR